MTMTALRLESWRSAPVLREVPVPEPGPGEVRVQVGGAGARRSGLHLMDESPVMLGHEDAGSVAVVIGIGHLAVQVLEATTAAVVPHEEYRP